MRLTEPLARLRSKPVQQFLFKGLCQFQQVLASIIGLTGCALPGFFCFKRFDQTVVVPA